MRAPDEGTPDERSAVADAIGGAAAYSARVAARVWRGPLEAAAEELLATPEVRRARAHARDHAGKPPVSGDGRSRARQPGDEAVARARAGRTRGSRCAEVADRGLCRRGRE